MKRVFLILYLSLLCGTVLGESPRRGALIKMDTVAHDFGRVSRRGGALEHTFTVENVGEEALVITEASTTCTCIKVKFSKSPIPPNTKSPIVVKYELQRKETGVFHRVIKLMSNSIDGAQLITIHGFSKDE